MEIFKQNKNLQLLLLSSFVNRFGDVIFDLFIIWKITINNNSIMDAVYLLSGSFIFRAVLAMFSGIVVDRFNKKKLILIANVSSIIIITLFAFNFNTFLENINICLILILTNNINNEIFYRSSLAIGAEISDKPTFIRYQSISSIASKSIDIMGSAIVGLLIAIIPDLLIFIIDIFTFLCSSLFIIKIKYVCLNNKSIKQSNNIIFNIIDDIKVSIHYIYNEKFIRYFTIIMCVLNLAYGFIPNILPLIFSAENNSSISYGIIKSSITIGSVLGLILVTKFGNKVSLLFKISMLGCAICMLSMLLPLSMILIILLFLSYGFFDAITQPLFSYTVSSIDNKIRSKVLGGIDTIILLSPSLGMYLGTIIIQYNYYWGFVFLATIFIIALLLILKSEDLNHIEVANSESMKQQDSYENHHN